MGSTSLLATPVFQYIVIAFAFGIIDITNNTIENSISACYKNGWDK